MNEALAEHPGPGSLRPDEVHLWSVELTTPGKLPRATLRRILAGYLGIGAEQVPLAIAPRGKPLLAGVNGPAFNLSHSGSLAVVAVCARETVGIDIERLRGRPREQLLARVLSPEEQEAVRACAPAERERAFLRHWTAKEACVKARGTGITDDLNALWIIDALERPAARGLGMEDLHLQRYDPREDMLGTVAVSGGPWRAVPLRPTMG